VGYWKSNRIRCRDPGSDKGELFRRASNLVPSAHQHQQNHQDRVIDDDDLVGLAEDTILDPGANDAEAIYRVVDELRQFTTVYILITSRTSTVPPVKLKEIPSLPRDAASKIFRSIRVVETASLVIEELLKELEYHALSVTLLATVSLQNWWGDDKLAREWGKRPTGILANRHSKDDPANSLTTTIDLSLGSTMFTALGGDAREVLKVVAFLPQGMDEEKLEWMFPTVACIQDIIDTFCILSLTHRAGSFVTMLAPAKLPQPQRSPRSPTPHRQGPVHRPSESPDG